MFCIFSKIFFYFKKKIGLRNVDSGGSVSLEFRQSTASTAPSDRLMATKLTLINKIHRQGEAY